MTVCSFFNLKWTILQLYHVTTQTVTEDSRKKNILTINLRYFEKLTLNEKEIFFPTHFPELNRLAYYIFYGSASWFKDPISSRIKKYRPRKMATWQRRFKLYIAEFDPFRILDFFILTFSSLLQRKEARLWRVKNSIWFLFLFASNEARTQSLRCQGCCSSKCIHQGYISLFCCSPVPLIVSRRKLWPRKNREQYFMITRRNIP